MTTTNLTEAQRLAIVKMHRQQPLCNGFVDELLYQRFRQREIVPLIEQGIMESTDDLYGTQLTRLGVELAKRIIKEQEGGGG